MRPALDSFDALMDRIKMQVGRLEPIQGDLPGGLLSGILSMGRLCRGPAVPGTAGSMRSAK